MEIITQRGIQLKFFNMSVADILRAVDGKSLMGSFILALCCIDHLAQATKPGEKTDREDYKLCVREFLGTFNEKYKNVDSHIYAIRNSLIHSYGESESSKKLKLEFLISNNFFESHLEIKQNEDLNLIQIDLPSFLSEVICAAFYFFYLNRKDIELLYKWNEKLLNIYNIDPSNYLFEQLHRHLHYFDKTLNLNQIQISLAEDIRKQCNS